tara:strand:- start:76 stop:342 length:267 start_codon:yes stop_codon:yes gene_type:complete
MNDILKDKDTGKPTGEVLETTPEEDIIDTIVDRQDAKISEGKYIVNVNLTNPVAVGKHALENIEETEKALKKIADAESIIEVIKKHKY